MMVWHKIDGPDSYPPMKSIIGRWSAAVLVWNGKNMWVDSCFHSSRGVNFWLKAQRGGLQPTHWAELPEPPDEY